MEITKEFKIVEVRATTASNVPFNMTLKSNSHSPGLKDSELTMDTETCAQYQFSPTLALVGAKLKVTFQPKDIPLYEDGPWKDYTDYRSIQHDDVLIYSLSRIETVRPLLIGIKPPMFFHEISRILELATFYSGAGIHFSIIPCPFYKFFLDLSEEEYESCKSLPLLTVLKVDFQLKS